jgi:hypothetical protein
LGSGWDVGRQAKASSRKAFFFEIKKQKTFAQFASAFPQRLSLNVSKFFGSFFQKRTAFFAALMNRQPARRLWPHGGGGGV